MSDGQQLRARMRQQNPSVQDFEIAAANRLDDALALLLGRRLFGAVYLLGYVAEMYLKIAVYRRLGARPTGQAAAFFRHARQRARELGLWQHQDQWASGHGLMFWARLLWSLPNAEGHTLASSECRALYRHVRRIEDRWAVEMRYLTDAGNWPDAERVLASVEWIRRNRLALWR